VEKKEFRLAQICGLNLIVDAEQLQNLVKDYERNGYFDELISLLEQGLGLGKFFPSVSLPFVQYLRS
jgi:clathrin heavy chain